MLLESLTRPGGTAEDRNVPVTVNVLGADKVSLRRVKTALRVAGLPATICEVSEPLEVAPEVLIVWSGRGITARDALLSRLCARHPDTHLIVVGPCDSPSSVRSAIEAGAHGMVFEPDLDRALPATVVSVLAEQVSVPASLRRGLGTPTFTAREKQILGLVVLGLANKEIGARLFLADSTVKSHLSSVFNKLGVRSRHEAVSVILDPESKLGLGILGISATARRSVEVAS